MSESPQVRRRFPAGIALLLYTFALIGGVALSAESCIALSDSYQTPDSSDPNSVLHTRELIVGLLLCAGAIFGILQLTVERGALRPKRVDPLSLPWALRRIRNAILALAPVLLLACALPLLLAWEDWSHRVAWASVEVPADPQPRLNRCLTNGQPKDFYTSVYRFQAQGNDYLAEDVQTSPPTAKTQTIWYDPLDPRRAHAGARPPVFADSFAILLAFGIPGALLALMLLLVWPQLRANRAWRAAASSTPG